MKRRDFLKTGLAGGAAALTGTACVETGREESPAGGEGRGAASGAGTPQVGPFELDEVTVDELRQSMADGGRTARSIAEAYLGRIEEIDGAGPELGAVIEVNPDALEIADELDRERQEGRVRGPLHGIPIILKDNIDTADDMMTTAGSLALEGPAPAEDSAVAARLREAGALILAKANLSEWANFRSTRSTSGWSGRGGQTRNPWALDRNPCGSSSGSGVAASANLCAVAIGTETDGSVVCPANANGVVGIKPTVGLVSRAGIVPISHTQDTAGPMARTVRDAALVLGSLTGVDERDPATRPGRERALDDYVLELDEAARLRGARIGVARDFFGFHDRVDGVMEEALEALRDGGAELVDPAEVSLGDELGDAEFEVMLYEFKAGLNDYLSGRRGVPVSSLEEAIAFNEENAGREMPYFGQEIFHMAQEKGPLSDPAYREALSTCRRLSRAEGIDRVMDENELDALVAPTDGPAWMTDLVNGDHYLGGSSTAAAVAGYPSVTVPAGHVFGLPVGISFFGRAWSELTLIRLAHAFERATGHRRAPGFLPTARLAI